MDEQQQGRILYGTGGFYYVACAAGTVECRARGIFRREGVTPLAGDVVRISLQSEDKGTVEEIEPRRNFLIRPPVANAELLLMVLSTVQPVPNLQVTDSVLAVAEDRDIPAAVAVTKSDLAEAEKIRLLYEKAGFPVFVVSATDGEGLEPLKAYLRGKMTVFTGNSGVGKSSLLNALDPHLQLATAQISQKLGRGRHTTRTSVLYPQAGGGYFVDTPGFSSLDVEKAAPIPEERLPGCFREFEPYLGQCRFTSCRHGAEPGCAVRAAVEQGDIAESRYQSYGALVEKARRAEAARFK